MKKKRYLIGAIIVLFLLAVLCIFWEAIRKRNTVKESAGENVEYSITVNKKKKKQKEDKVNVVLCTTNYQSRYHSKVEVSSDSDFYVTIDGVKKKYSKNKKFKVDSSDSIDEKIKIEPKAGAMLEVLSIKRQERNPKYRGCLKIYKKKQGFVLVNRLGIEEYLYSVVSSEISPKSDMEALKAQAVCSRTYVYSHLKSKKYKKYRGDMDDSSSCQVYNNNPEDVRVRKAVKETAGEVLKKDGKLISSYYYSTSWGYSASGQDVWNTEAVINYLPEKLQIDKQEELSLKSEKKFRRFIEDRTKETFDSSSLWYRWRVSVSEKNLTSRMLDLLQTCYQENPEDVLTQTESGTYVKKPIKTIGRIRKIRIEKRKNSGLVTELVIAGKSNVVKISTQYNIRRVLGSMYEKIVYNHGKSETYMRLLPSAAFYINRVQRDGEIYFDIIGGGFGHGTGMSQSGAVEQAKRGRNHEEILSYYFTGAKVTKLN